MSAEVIRNYAQAAFAIAGVFGILFGFVQYRRSVRTDESELIYKLFVSFYETDHHETVRQLIDQIGHSVSEEEAERILTGTGPGQPGEKEFVNYLNFFEFILGLIERKRLRRKDVDWIFDYYITTVFTTAFIRAYVFKYGFECLQREFERRENIRVRRRS